MEQEPKVPNCGEARGATDWHVLDVGPVMGRASEVSVRTLAGCEVVLERGSDTFVEVGRALLETLCVNLQ